MKNPSTKRKQLERRVLETALADYRRLRDLKWNASYFGGTARQHWTACKRLDEALVGRKK